VFAIAYLSIGSRSALILDDTLIAARERGLGGPRNLLVDIT
jgi:hypothetical protein